MRDTKLMHSSLETGQTPWGKPAGSQSSSSIDQWYAIRLRASSSVACDLQKSAAAAKTPPREVERGGVNSKKAEASEGLALSLLLTLSTARESRYLLPTRL
eukprot:GHUV01056402.1.p3 GENE.GHUV01056402.1~~GHUV01056402.1.p3  ORF type:complete len:101 (+),score=25.76 GHUV01056402.1:350-652(+)